MATTSAAKLPRNMPRNVRQDTGAPVSTRPANQTPSRHRAASGVGESASNAPPTRKPAAISGNRGIEDKRMGGNIHVPRGMLSVS